MGININDENEFKNVLNELLGRGGSTQHECLIAIGMRDGIGVIIEGDDTIDNVFDGCRLEDNIDTKTLPSDPGIYKCVIEISTWKCNNYYEPEEWDMNISIKSYTKIEV